LVRKRNNPTSKGAIAATPRYQPSEGPQVALAVSPGAKDAPQPLPEHDPKKELPADEPPVDEIWELIKGGCKAKRRVGASMTRTTATTARAPAHLDLRFPPEKARPAAAQPSIMPPMTRPVTTSQRSARLLKIPCEYVPDEVEF
jgi:hypothetical protein